MSAAGVIAVLSAVVDMSVAMIAAMGTLATPAMTVEEDMIVAMTVLKGRREDMTGVTTADMTAPTTTAATLTGRGVAVVLGMLFFSLAQSKGIAALVEECHLTKSLFCVRVVTDSLS